MDWNDQGPSMRYQRLGVSKTESNSSTQADATADSMTYTPVCTVAPPITSNAARLHATEIILSTDYHLLHCPPTVHDHPTGQPRIGDNERNAMPNHCKPLTTLNRSIHFRIHEGFRADDLVYFEPKTPWTGGVRGELLTRMLTKGRKAYRTLQAGSVLGAAR
ncbi:hypothetical protein DOTSEDRAFT_40820 [Dothistroma septosporum NZE10]|uniref:Uncharacterized protein n=1 Tax=Dothistroma septosporum (strain NZE10 / CBS 128990) TaxID=675120 RepID=N1Q4R3_DOTSN|nr:hypothetical protein DOTSEDRAFT_40820 [Dothistroma septosporum NZE10]